MTLSDRCSTCAVDWPNDYKDFSKCPDCEGPTDVISGGEPLDLDEALSRKRHADFDRFYADWDVRNSGLQDLPVAQVPGR